MTWADKFIGLARYVGSWSKDPSTKVGAVVVNRDNRIVSVGYNGFPQGVKDDLKEERERYERPTKYMYTEHAERNAIYNASRLSVSLMDCTLYCTHFPCADCARAIIQSGISQLVFEHRETEGNKTTNVWTESTEIAYKMLEEAEIQIIEYYE